MCVGLCMLSMVTTKARRKYRTSYWVCEPPSVVLGTELGSPAKEVSTLTRGTISLAPKELVLRLSGTRWEKSVAL